MFEKLCLVLLLQFTEIIQFHPSKKTAIPNILHLPTHLQKTCELLLYNYINLYHFSSISLRFFTVYGPRQRPDLAIHKFFNAVLNEQPIVIYGDGSSSRDYTYIDDTVDGIIKAFGYLMNNSEMYEIFNLGNNTPTTLKDLVSYIEDVTDKKAMFYHEKMQPGDVQHTLSLIHI